MQDSKFQLMIENFVVQWLFTRDVARIHKQEELHTALRHVRREMVLETEMLFSHMLREDRNVIELLAADYTYLNEPLADYYGIADVTGEKMRLVYLLSGSHRGGDLGPREPFGGDLQSRPHIASKAWPIRFRECPRNSCTTSTTRHS